MLSNVFPNQNSVANIFAGVKYLDKLNVKMATATLLF